MSKLKKIIFYITLFILSWVYAIRFFDMDYDLWARLAVGKVFVNLGQIMFHDPFSFTLKKDLWVDHEWGSSVVFYTLSKQFGDMGLILLKIIVLFLVLFFIQKAIQVRKNQTSYGILYYLLLILAMHNGFASTVRCQIFTFLFFSIWMFSLEKVRNDKDKYLVIFPATMLIWANMHGGFVAGLGLLFAYGAGEFLTKRPWQKYFYIFLPTVIITLINPYGFEYWKYIASAVTMLRPNIVEWQPTSLIAGGIGLWFAFKVLLLITILSLIFYFYRQRFKDIDYTKIIVLGLMLFMALKHIKHQPFFVIAAGSLIYDDFCFMLEAIKGKFQQIFKIKVSQRVANLSYYATHFFLIVLGTLIIIGTNHQLRVPMEKYPVLEVEFIKQNGFKGNLVAPFNWGSYLVYKLYPSCQVAIDGRYEEVYSHETEYMVTNFVYMSDDNWYDLADKYKLDILLLSRDNPSYAQIKQKAQWKEIFHGPNNSIFVPSKFPVKNLRAPDVDLIKINSDKYKTYDNFLDKIKEFQNTAAIQDAF